MNYYKRSATVLVADIENYSGRMEQDEDRTMSLLQKYLKVIREEVQHYAGALIKNYGDGSLCLFSCPCKAIKCALDIQSRLTKEPNVPIRIGLAQGDVLICDDGVYGHVVNTAFRLESFGRPGTILLSESVFVNVKKSEFNFVSLGKIKLKNIKPLKIYALTEDSLPSFERKITSINFDEKPALSYATSLLFWLMFMYILIS